MNVLYLVLYILAAICFLVSAAGVITVSDPPRHYARYNLVALGLFFWVLVPLIAQIKAM
jgi:hypothetical protein